MMMIRRLLLQIFGLLVGFAMNIDGYSPKRRLVGVIGGLGPEASVDFMSSVMQNTPASIDQDHVSLILHHDPTVPSRQDAIKGIGESPGPNLAKMAATLELAGCEFVVMPCNLAHNWQHDIQEAIQIPFLSIIDVTVSAAIQHSSASSETNNKIGLFTTPGCFHANLYQNALAQKGYEVELQTPAELEQTMNLVYKVKAGDKSPEVVNGLREIGNALVERGASVVIAACTELPLVLNQEMFRVPLVSSTDELAKRTVELALGNDENDALLK